MPGIKIRGYDSIELNEENTRRVDLNKPINHKDLYRDDSLERDDN